MPKCQLLLALLIFSIFCNVDAHGEDEEARKVEKDFEGWFAASYTKEFDFKGELTFEQQIRLFEYRETFSEIAFEYPLLDFFAIGSEVRFVFMKGGRTSYRVAPFVEISGARKDLKIGYTFKYTNDFSRFNSPRSELRNSIDVKYDVKKKWRIQAGFGMFIAKKQKVNPYFSQFRWTLGVRHKINKKHRITTFYRLDQNFDDKDKDSDVEFQHIFGLSYNFKH